MLRKKAQDESFSDGFVRFCRIQNIARPGDLPKEDLVEFLGLRFRRRTVGIQRNYLAKQAHEQIDELIRCPYSELVSVRDKAVIGDRKFIVRQIQYPEDTAFPVMDLSLERIEGD